MSDHLPIAESEPELAPFAALDWADQKHAWRLVPVDSSTRTGRIGKHTGSGRSVGYQFVRAFSADSPSPSVWNSPAGPWSIYAQQVYAPRVVPHAPQHRGALSPGVLSFLRQGRSPRCRVFAGSVVASP